MVADITNRREIDDIARTSAGGEARAAERSARNDWSDPTEVSHKQVTVGSLGPLNVLRQVNSSLTPEVHHNSANDEAKIAGVFLATPFSADELLEHVDHIGKSRAV